MSEIPYFEDRIDSDRRGIEASYYSLRDIASYLGINATDAISDIQHEYKKVNHQFGKKCMEAIIEKFGLSFYAEANCEVKGMRDLPHMYYNSIERSDIIVYTDSEKTNIVLT